MLCAMFVCTGRLTAVQRCPHACRWSRASQMNFSSHTATRNTLSGEWRPTSGPASCVTWSCWLEIAEYLHTGNTYFTQLKLQLILHPILHYVCIDVHVITSSGHFHIYYLLLSYNYLNILHHVVAKVLLGHCYGILGYC